LALTGVSNGCDEGKVKTVLRELGRGVPSGAIGPEDLRKIYFSRQSGTPSFISSAVARVPVRGAQRLTFDRPMKSYLVKTLIAFLVWCLLLVVSWPLALLVVVLFPFVWLLSLPFRLVGISVEAIFALIRTILFLPARIFGWRRTA